MQLSEQLDNKTVRNTKRRMSKSPNGAENAKKKPTLNNDYDLVSDSDYSVYESEADPNPSTSTAHHKNRSVARGPKTAI